MPNDGFDAGPSPEPLPGFALLIRAGLFPGFLGDLNPGAIDNTFTPVSSVADRHLCPSAHQLLALLERFGEGVAIIDVLWETHGSYNDTAVLCHNNGGFRSKLILLVIFAFAYAVHLGFMDAVDFIFAFSLLAQDSLIDLNFWGVC